jgi:hypothetical protein
MIFPDPVIVAPALMAGYVGDAMPAVEAAGPAYKYKWDKVDM